MLLWFRLSYPRSHCDKLQCAEFLGHSSLSFVIHLSIWYLCSHRNGWQWALSSYLSSLSFLSVPTVNQCSDKITWLHMLSVESPIRLHPSVSSCGNWQGNNWWKKERIWYKCVWGYHEACCCDVLLYNVMNDFWITDRAFNTDIQQPRDKKTLLWGIWFLHTVSSYESFMFFLEVTVFMHVSQKRKWFVWMLCVILASAFGECVCHLLSASCKQPGDVAQSVLLQVWIFPNVNSASVSTCLQIAHLSCYSTAV